MEEKETAGVILAAAATNSCLRIVAVHVGAWQQSGRRRTSLLGFWVGVFAKKKESERREPLFNPDLCTRFGENTPSPLQILDFDTISP